MDTTNATQSSSKQLRRPKVVLMWRGNIRAPHQPTNHAERLKPLIGALADSGIETSSLVYFDGEVEGARGQLLEADGVMVWINPLQDGQDRRVVDAMLRDVAARGVWVSASPDTILKLGTKEVLYQTRDLGWGSDTEFYRSFDDFQLRFPLKLSLAGPRVLKPLRGNDGQGVFKVALAPGHKDRVCVQAASDDQTETLPVNEFFMRAAERFGDSTGLIDQAYHPNVAAGMVRCCMSGDLVVGFAEQSPRRDRDAFGMNSAKTMHGADVSAFQDLRTSMEQDWVPAMQRKLDLSASALPALWDADFLYRSPGGIAASRFVLCEINVSSVSPFPEIAAPAIAAVVAKALRR